MTSYKHGGLGYNEQVRFDSIGKNWDGGFLIFSKEKTKKKKRFLFF